MGLPEYQPDSDFKDFLVAVERGFPGREDLYKAIKNKKALNFDFFLDENDEEKIKIKDDIKELLNKDKRFVGFVLNMHPSARSQVEFSAYKNKKEVNFNNIAFHKNEIRLFNKKIWTRDQNDSEKQGGASVLGGISEELIRAALGSACDSRNLMRCNLSSVKSYGDFVLMCLPNNLWISVKSAFSRERLLASGYANDLIGVGFFQDAKEFKSLAKIRNFKKVGFLAIYLPDTPVSDEQARGNTNTYEDVVSSHRDAVKNINGKDFFRPISSLGDDINALLAENLDKRTTIDF